jgi:hypothetical protein
MSSEVSRTEKVGADLQEYANSESGVVVDPDRKAREKALVRKLDLFIAPVMMLLQLISYLDRGNIGFAATQGMTKDIHLHGTNLNVCSPFPVSLHLAMLALICQTTDCRFRLLHLLHPRRISHRHLCQAPTVQPVDSHHHFCLGCRLSRHWLRSQLWLACCHSRATRILRRLSLCLHDHFPVQLVQARGIGRSCGLSVR